MDTKEKLINNLTQEIKRSMASNHGMAVNVRFAQSIAEDVCRKLYILGLGLSKDNQTTNSPCAKCGKINNGQCLGTCEELQIFEVRLKMREHGIKEFKALSNL